MFPNPARLPFPPYSLLTPSVCAPPKKINLKQNKLTKKTRHGPPYFQHLFIYPSGIRRCECVTQYVYCDEPLISPRPPVSDTPSPLSDVSLGSH